MQESKSETESQVLKIEELGSDLLCTNSIALHYASTNATTNQYPE